MRILPELYPAVADLLAIPTEELVGPLLRYAVIAAERQGGRFEPTFVFDIAIGDDSVIPGRPHYPPMNKTKLRAKLAEAWNFIEREGFVMTSPDMNGAHGFKVFTDKGHAAAQNFDPQKYREATVFSRELLHPTIIAEAWPDYISSHRNHLQKAVFNAFLAVEDAVRTAAGLPNDLHGVDLMRRAFNDANGPLTNLSDPIGERQALAHLFAGAYGVFRNPNGHRYTGLNDLRDAQHQLLLASLLLSIVDARKPQTPRALGCASPTN